VVEQESTIAEYYDLKEKIGVYEQDMKDVMNHPNYCLPFIQPGRLVRIKHEKRLFDWGVVINFSKRLKPFVSFHLNSVLTSQSQEEDFKPQESYIIDVAMWIDASSVSSGQRIKQKDLPAIIPGPDGINSKMGRMEVVPVVMSTIDEISQLRVPLPGDLKGTEQRLDLRKTVEEVKRRFPDGLPNLDPIKNMSITDESFRTLVKVCPQAIVSNEVEN
jgi:ATP-dependent RNA helicase DOB1